MNPTTWTPKNGAEVKIDRLEDKYLLDVITELQKLAEIKRRAMVSVYRESTGILSYFAKMVTEQPSYAEWSTFADDVFWLLVAEAQRRGLTVPEQPILEEDLEIPLTQRGSLERQIVGAIRNAIHAHGPINAENAPSTAKRVIGAIRYHNRRIKT